MYLHQTQELGDLGRFGFRSITRAISRAVPREIKRPVMQVVKPVRHLVQTKGFRKVVAYGAAIPTGFLSLSLLSKKPLKTASEIALTEAAIAAAAYGGYAAYGALTAPSAESAAISAAASDAGMLPAGAAVQVPAAATSSSGFSWTGLFKTLTTGLETTAKVLPAVISAGKFIGARQAGGDQTGGAYGSGFGPGSGIPGTGIDMGSGIIPGASPVGAPPDQLQPGEQPAQDMTPWILGGGIVLVGFLVMRGTRKRR